MPAVRNVLVVGGGAAGAATAILLAEGGVSVDLIDIKPDVGRARLRHHAAGQRPAGAAPARRLGPGQGAGLRVRHARPARPRPARHADRRARPTSAPAAPTCPPRSACTGPTLARILIDRAAAVGVKVRFGTTYTALDQDADGVDVTFADGSTGRYDLVVGADGIRSWTRRSSASTWRPERPAWASGGSSPPRPASVTRTDLFYGGPSYIAGYCPTGEDTLYAYIVEDAQDRSTLSPEESLAAMRGAVRGLPRAVGRHPRHPHRPVPGELHLVREPRARRRRGTAAGSC